MGRWLKQTDTLIIMTLGIGLFLFRFGDETWAAVSPRLVRVQGTLGAQLDAVTTALTSSSDSAQAEVLPATSPASFSPGTTQSIVSISSQPSPPCVVVHPRCGYSCQH